MGFVSDYRASRRDDRELGKGVWRRAHDRFRRGLDRYHQVLESVTDQSLRPDAVAVANDLADLLPRVRQLCMEAHRRAPSDADHVPAGRNGHYLDAHREISRAGNAMAQTAEALTMARYTAGASANASDTPDPRVHSIRRRAQAVHEAVGRAEQQLR